MNRTRLTSLLPKLLLVIATVAIGVVVGRATQPDNADSTADSTEGTGSTSVIDGTVADLDVISPVFVGSTPPPAPTDDDASLGLGDIVDTQQAVVPNLPTDDTPALPTDAPGPIDLSEPGPVTPTSPLDTAEMAVPSTVGGVTPIDVLFDELAIEPSEPGGDPVDDFDLRPYVDPCAPRPDGDDAGPPAADCPNGTRATVLPIVSLGDAYITMRQVGRAGARGASCPESTPATSGGLVLEMMTNAPGDFVITITDIAGRNGNVGTFNITTAAADAEAWATALAAGVDPNQLSSLIVHCVALDDLPPNARLVAFARFTRAEDGDNAYALKEVITTPSPVRPPTLVVPIGTNRLLVSVAHTRAQFASLDAWVSLDGQPSCEPTTAPGDRLRSNGIINSTADINALRARGYDENYRRRTTAIFWVPEGRSINVCARTFDSTGPSFRTSQPAQRDATVVHSPDMVVPVVSVESVTPRTRLAGARAQVWLSWARGDFCGSYSGTFNDVNAIDPPDYDNVCDGGAPSGASGHASNVVVTTGLRTAGSSESVETRAVLPVRARACTGGDDEGFGATCPSPPTEWYRVPLATIPVRTGICSPGLFESTCEPPTRDAVAGTVTVRVDWVQGGVSGRSGWLVEPIVAGGRATELPAAPQLDLTRYAEVTGEGVRQGVNFNLLADRPVDWTLTVPEGTCRREDATEPVWRSSATSPQFTVRANGFCTSVWVQFIVTLTDPATGASSTYGNWPLAWAGGYVTMPPSVRPLTVAVGIEAPDDFYPLWTPHDVYVQIDRPESTQFIHPWGSRYDFPTPLQRDPAFRCDQNYRPFPGVYGWSHEGYGVPTAIADEIRIRVTVELSQAEGSVDRCRPIGYLLVTVIEVTISEAELAAARDGIRIAAPDDAPFPVEVVVRLDG